MEKDKFTGSRNTDEIGTAFYSSGLADTNRLSHLSSRDKEIICKYNSTDKPIPKTTIKEMLAESFEKYANQCALSDGSNSMTYHELDKISMEIGEKLLKLGATRGDIIGVHAEKSISTIAAAIGIMRNGYVYLPIHANYPEEKKQHIFKNCNCRFFMKDNQITILDTFHPDVKNELVLPDEAESLAYIIYTSGSTGLPKGVAISGESVCNTVLDINQRFGVNNSDCFIGLSALTFDLSIYDILGAFQSGAELLVVKDQRDIRSILNILRSGKITLWNSVPAIMEMTLMAAEEGEVFENMRNILLSGDHIPVTLPEKIKRFFPNSEIYSLGGATEGSIWSIYYPMKDISPDSVRVPYGIPLANQTMTVRDNELNICPIGTEGEICIGGKGVAMGYFNDSEKTAAAFVQADEGLIYRTGDRGVMTDEYIDFLGRIDRQVKLNGYRIETGEVESAALRSKNITAASAFVYTDHVSDGKLLALCYTSETEIVEEKLREELKNRLVDYMMPHILMRIDHIPLTSNGKVNIDEMCRIIASSVDTDDETDFDEFEVKIAKIWKAILGVNSISRKSNFFSCGGDSLKAMRMIEALEKEDIISDNISVTDIFSVTDFGSLAERLRKAYEEKQKEEEDMEEGEL